MTNSTRPSNLGLPHLQPSVQSDAQTSHPTQTASQVHQSRLPPPRLMALGSSRAPSQPQVSQTTPPQAQFAPLPVTTQPVFHDIKFESQGVFFSACGNACMNMVATYHGRTTKPVGQSLLSNPLGLKFSELEKEMYSRGIDSQPVRVRTAMVNNKALTPEFLSSALQTCGPLIAAFKGTIPGTGHYAVIHGYDGVDKVCVADPFPGRGFMEYSLAELNSKLDFGEEEILMGFKPSSRPAQ
jgi:hypothetical protein